MGFPLLNCRENCSNSIRRPGQRTRGTVRKVEVGHRAGGHVQGRHGVQGQGERGQEAERHATGEQVT